MAQMRRRLAQHTPISASWGLLLRPPSRLTVQQPPAHTWAQAVVGVRQSSRHLGCHCHVQHQHAAANSGQFSPPCIIHIWTVHHPNVRKGTTMAFLGLLEGLWNKPKPHADFFSEGHGQQHF